MLLCVDLLPGKNGIVKNVIICFFEKYKNEKLSNLPQGVTFFSTLPAARFVL